MSKNSLVTYGKELAALLHSELTSRKCTSFLLIIYENKTDADDCRTLLKNAIEAKLVGTTVHVDYAPLGGGAYTAENMFYAYSSDITLSIKPLKKEFEKHVNGIISKWGNINFQNDVEHKQRISDRNLRANRSFSYNSPEPKETEWYRYPVLFEVSKGNLQHFRIVALHAPGPDEMKSQSKHLGEADAIIKCYFETANDVGASLIAGDFNQLHITNASWTEISPGAVSTHTTKGSTYKKSGGVGNHQWDKMFAKFNRNIHFDTPCLVNAHHSGLSDHLAFAVTIGLSSIGIILTYGLRMLAPIAIAASVAYGLCYGF